MNRSLITMSSASSRPLVALWLILKVIPETKRPVRITGLRKGKYRATSTFRLFVGYTSLVEYRSGVSQTLRCPG
jgi:hypothetical protein